MAREPEGVSAELAIVSFNFYTERLSGWLDAYFFCHIAG